MPFTPRRPRGGTLRPARAFPAALPAAVALAVALAGCGGDDSDDGGSETTSQVTGPEVVAQLEDRLKESINGEVTGTPNPPKRTVEEVACPDDVDLGAVQEEYVCEISGSGETGEIGLVVTAPETFNYGGDFGGTGEFGQGITLTPPEDLPDEESGGGQGGSEGDGSGGGGSNGNGG